PMPLEAHHPFRVIYADHGHANRTPSASPELANLVAKHSNYPHDLLNHGFREDFDFYPDFHGGDRSASNGVARIAEGRPAWDELCKRAVATPSRDTAASVLRIQDAIRSLDCRLAELGRPIDRDEILVQMHRDKIALARIAVLVNLAFKQTPEFREQPV